MISETPLYHIDQGIISDEPNKMIVEHSGKLFGSIKIDPQNLCFAKRNGASINYCPHFNTKLKT